MEFIMEFWNMMDITQKILHTIIFVIGLLLVFLEPTYFKNKRKLRK